MAEIAIVVGLYTLIVASGGSLVIRKVMNKIKKKKIKKEEEKKRLIRQAEKLEKRMKKYTTTKHIKLTSKKAEELCVICQDDFKENNERSKLQCGHIYHKCCIKEWIKHKKTCPLCNTTLKKRKRKNKNKQ